MSAAEKMASKTELSLHLEKKQLEWLATMAKKYDLPSIGALFSFRTWVLCPCTCPELLA